MTIASSKHKVLVDSHIYSHLHKIVNGKYCYAGVRIIMLVINFEKHWKKMLEQIKRSLVLITVEPIRFIFSFQWAVCEIVRQNLFIEKGKFFYIFI